MVTDKATNGAIAIPVYQGPHDWQTEMILAGLKGLAAKVREFSTNVGLFFCFFLVQTHDRLQRELTTMMENTHPHPQRRNRTHLLVILHHAPTHQVITHLLQPLLLVETVPPRQT